MIKANFHTHTNYSDGKNTPEEMVEAALSLGMTALGFSEHSYTTHDRFGLTVESAAAYRCDILHLKEKYKDRIEIFLGLEQDIESDKPDYPYEYLIGSVHSVKKGGHTILVDFSEDCMCRAVETFYNGDYYAYAEDYFQQVSRVAQVCSPTFIGHFDLIAKFNEGGKYFDEAHPRYRAAALGALSSLLPYGKPFEINTGAISRGYRQTPYPAPFILKAIHDAGGQIILSSDSHSTDSLLCAFAEATELARRAGFTESLIITCEGLKAVPLI